MIVPSLMLRRFVYRLLLRVLDAADRPGRLPKREEGPQDSAATTSTPRPEGPAHAPRMRTPTTILFAVLCLTSCTRDGCNRPDPPDPVPCKPGQDCPVLEQPGPPISQPPATPVPATKVEPDPPPT